MACEMTRMRASDLCIGTMSAGPRIVHISCIHSDGAWVVGISIIQSRRCPYLPSGMHVLGSLSVDPSTNAKARFSRTAPPVIMPTMKLTRACLAGEG